MAHENTAVRRRWAELMGALREDISSGKYPSGQFLPPVRALSAELGVAPETLRRGLKLLEGEGLLASEPRQGFRVVTAPADERRHCPVAYVTTYSGEPSTHEPTSRALTAAFQDATAGRGWSTLTAHVGGQAEGVTAEQLRAARAWGAALDTLDAPLLETFEKLGIPVVMVNSWREDQPVDVVMQDNYTGGFKAASRLIEAGAERIAWLGPVGQHCHSRQRYSGAIAGLLAAGRDLDPRLRSDVELSESHAMKDSDAYAKARALLSRRDRPDGILAMWANACRSVKRAADELGLVIGRDFQMVGWSVEELFESQYCPIFAGGPVPPAVVWKARSMAESALGVLARRRGGDTGEPVRISVPTRIRVAE